MVFLLKELPLARRSPVVLGLLLLLLMGDVLVELPVPLFFESLLLTRRVVFTLRLLSTLLLDDLVLDRS